MVQWTPQFSQSWNSPSCPTQLSAHILITIHFCWVNLSTDAAKPAKKAQASTWAYSGWRRRIIPEDPSICFSIRSLNKVCHTVNLVCLPNHIIQHLSLIYGEVKVAYQSLHTHPITCSLQSFRLLLKSHNVLSFFRRNNSWCPGSSISYSSTAVH